MQAFKFLLLLEGLLIWEMLSGNCNIVIGLVSKFLKFCYFYGHLGWVLKFLVADFFICTVFQLEITKSSAVCAGLLCSLKQIQQPFFIILMESHWSDLLTFYFGELGGNWFGLFFAWCLKLMVFILYFCAGPWTVTGPGQKNDRYLCFGAALREPFFFKFASTSVSCLYPFLFL